MSERCKWQSVVQYRDLSHRLDLVFGDLEACGSWLELDQREAWFLAKMSLKGRSDFAMKRKLGSPWNMSMELPLPPAASLSAIVINVHNL